jgi:hypothetical protein
MKILKRGCSRIGESICNIGMPSAKRVGQLTVFSRSPTAFSLGMTISNQTLTSPFQILIGFVLSFSTTAMADLTLVDQLLTREHIQQYLSLAMGDFNIILDKKAKDLEIDPRRVAFIKGVADKIYKPQNLYQIFREVYVRNAKPEQVNQRLVWFDSGTGKILVESWDEEYAPDFMNQVAYYYKSHADMKIKENRKSVIRNYVAATKRMRQQITYKKWLEYSVNYALNVFKPSDARDPPAFVERRAEQVATSHAKRNEKRDMDNLLFLMRKAKSSDIDAMTKFATSYTGQTTINALHKSLEVSLERAAKTLFEACELRLPKPKGS